MRAQVASGYSDVAPPWPAPPAPALSPVSDYAANVHAEERVVLAEADWNDANPMEVHKWQDTTSGA